MNHLILTEVAAIIATSVSARSDKMVKWTYSAKSEQS